jgi:hypothetical protein
VLADESPVVILLNKCDQPHLGVPVQEYREVFEHIVVDLEVSCKDDHRATIKRLKEATREVITNKDLLPDIGSELPKRWVDIRGELEKLREKGENYISLKNYLDLCGKYGMDEDRALNLSDYFHRLGVFLHFRGSIDLQNTIFLNHEWVTKGVYNVLDNKGVISRQGEFTDEDLMTIWKGKKYKDKRAELVHLMQMFELCFRVDEGRYLAPQLLPDDVPETLEEFDDLKSLPGPLHYEYRYKFMPKGILTRLIVKMNKQIFQQTNWRYGVVLKYDNTKGLVRERYFDRKITIVISGENKKDLLGMIRCNIGEINESFPNIKVEEMIPCNCPDCRKSEAPHYYESSNLKERLRRSKQTVECARSYEAMNVHEVLGDVVTIEQDEEERRVYVYGDYYERSYGRSYGMRIRNVDVHGGQVNFADRIDKIEYHESIGISEDELKGLVAAVKELSAERRQVLDGHYKGLLEADTEEKRESFGGKIRDWLVESGIDAAKSLTVEAIKAWLLTGG